MADPSRDRLTADMLLLQIPCYRNPEIFGKLRDQNQKSNQNQKIKTSWSHRSKSSTHSADLCVSPSACRPATDDRRMGTRTESVSVEILRHQETDLPGNIFVIHKRNLYSTSTTYVPRGSKVFHSEHAILVFNGAFQTTSNVQSLPSPGGRQGPTISRGGMYNPHHLPYHAGHDDSHHCVFWPTAHVKDQEGRTT